MRPVVCMVTARFAAPTDENACARRIEAVARAGANLIQIRQPQLEGLALTRFVERALLAVEGSSARVLVNDRVDVALAAGAHGVHLRSNSMAAARIREIVPGAFVIGRSVHSLGEAISAEQAGGLDYLLFGTVFATSSKPDVTPAGTETLAAVCAGVALPVLAIGGIALSTLASVAGAGAAGFAAIGLFNATPVDAMPQMIEQASSAFDTSRSVS